MLSENLKKILDLRKLTQTELARMSGVKQVTISRIIAGRHEPGITQIEKIAKALHISVDELLDSKKMEEPQKNTLQEDPLTVKFKRLLDELPEGDTLLKVLEVLIDRELKKKRS